MKILMLGDYSNLHACLAKELRKRGHEITVVSDKGVYMRTQADVELLREPGLFGAARYLCRILSLLPSWRGFDVVQLINPHFLCLRPHKIRMVFDYLKKHNRSVFLTLCSNDHFFVKDCVESDLFRFSEFRIGKRPTQLAIESPVSETGWLIPSSTALNRHVYERIDGAMSVLPEYDMSARRHMDHAKLAFTNLPVELEALSYSPLETDGKVRILVGMRGKMEVQKGTAKLLELCRQVERELPGKCEVKCVKNLSLSAYLDELRRSHIVIDQLYSYSPATNALQTMALGRISASGGQPEYYEYVAETTRPVFCLSPLEDDYTIKQRLKELILDRERMARMSVEGRRLVEKHNDVRNVASIFEAHWQKMINRKN
ncbi:MAG: hypothetical protein NC204_03405 [Candidatus Amulumruptor caecigallinarius]|nr:hypothetical protein [Candidatus Amulumruptor caecigallinarius]